jgi:hydrogenase maturation protease
MSTSPTTDARVDTLVLALGNPLLGDDGLGAVVLDRLQAWEWPPAVVLADGETWGMRLLPLVEHARRLLAVDAIEIGAVPGTVVALEGDAMRRTIALSLSAHQVGLHDVLALAELRGTAPQEVVAIGAQPGRLVFGEPLSAPVAAAVDEVVARARRTLAAWGHTGRLRPEPAGA